MKKTNLPSKIHSLKQDKKRPLTSPLNTEERLKVLANLILDRLIEKYITNSVNRA